MRNIFVTYGDDNYLFSRRRLARLARKSKLFDEVRVFTPADLPPEITGSSLFSHKKGGGLWLWKPYVIRHMLDQCDCGDVVWYADSGCRLNPSSSEFVSFSSLLTHHDALYFAYRAGFDYKISRFRNNSLKLKHWTKPIARDFLLGYCGTDFSERQSLWGGFMAVKKTQRNLITDEWLGLMLGHPEIVTDPAGDELTDLPPEFNEHRHDQSLLSYIVYKLAKEDNALVIDETSESRIGDPLIIAERYRAGKTTFLQDIKTRIYFMFNDI